MSRRLPFVFPEAKDGLELPSAESYSIAERTVVKVLNDQKIRDMIYSTYSAAAALFSCGCCAGLNPVPPTLMKW